MTPCDAYKKWLESYEVTLLDMNATLVFWLSMQYSNIICILHCYSQSHLNGSSS